MATQGFRNGKGRRVSVQEWPARFHGLKVVTGNVAEFKALKVEVFSPCSASKPPNN
jgi:hypothetical protein